MKAFVAILLLALTAAVLSFRHAAAQSSTSPSMSHGWRGSGLSRDACVSRGVTSLRDAGFTITATKSEAVWGDAGQFVGTVYCGVLSHGIVYFVVAGPTDDQDRTDKYRDELERGW